jgi:hypothetical protein
VAGSTLLVATTAIAVTQFPDLRRRLAALLLLIVLGFGARFAKTAFDAIIQQDVPPGQRTTLFARRKASFRCPWVLGALVPTLVAMPLLAGFVVVAAVVLLLAAAVMILPLSRWRNRQPMPASEPDKPHGPAMPHHAT